MSRSARIRMVIDGIPPDVLMSLVEAVDSLETDEVIGMSFQATDHRGRAVGNSTREASQAIADAKKLDEKRGKR